jgi:cytochrome c oxidase assembly factor CtaG
MTTTRELLTSLWVIDPLALLACAVATGVYVASRRGRVGARAVFFAAALTAFAIALMSPIGTLASGYLFSAHMLQHLLLVLVVPPLALLGFPPAPGIAPEPSLRSGMPATRAGVRVPAVVAWGLGVGAMWLWHAPTLCNAASQSAVMHRVQELSLLAMGTAFWWPIVSPFAGARLSPLAGVAYLFTACVACTVLGVAITFSPVEVCSVFAHPVDRLGVMPLVRDRWGLTAQKDQQIGGLFMWVPACVVYGSAVLATLSRIFKEAPLAAEEAS